MIVAAELAPAASVLYDLQWMEGLRAPWLTPLFRALTWTGHAPFFFVALPLGYWLWRRDACTRLALLVAFTAIANAWLKELFQDPRPDLAWALDSSRGESFGRPSGHAQLATATWFWLAWELRRRWAWAAAAVLVAGVAASRLYLGVHDLDDVLWGLGLGAVGLGACWLLVQHTPRPWLALGPVGQVVALIALTPLLWLVWPTGRIPSNVVGMALFAAGWWAGDRLEGHRGHAGGRPSGWVAGALIVAVGLPGFALLQWLLRAGEGSGWLWAPVTAALGGFALGLYVTGLVPWLMRRLWPPPAPQA